MRRQPCTSPTPMHAFNKMRSILQVFAVCLVSFLVYLSSLDGGFVFDDHRGILTNDDLDPAKTSLWEVFQHDFWGGSMDRVESHKSYRPLTVLSYRYLNYCLTELRPYSYHLVNVLMHSAASVLYLFVCELVLGGGSVRWPVFASLLFAVHSIHTEAVASTVGRAEVFSCIFLLSALLVYSKAVSVKAKGSLTPIHRTKWQYIALSVLLSLCSMLSKEQGVTALGVCAGFDVLLHWEVLLKTFRWRSSRVVDTSAGQCNGGAGCNQQVNEAEGEGVANGSRKPENQSPVSFEVRAADHEANAGVRARVIKRVGVLVISVILLLWFRVSMNHGSGPIFKPEELRAAYHPNRTVRILSFSNIYAHNAWLLLSPSHLCCDWSLGSVPLVTSLSDPTNIWSLLLYACLAILVFHILKSKRDYFAVGMALSLLLLPFLPASGIVFRIGFVIAERVLYMPSLGSCLLVTIGLRRLSHFLNSEIWRYTTAVIMVYLLIIMGAKTFQRNKDWATDLSLFESGTKVNYGNVKVRNNYGMELKAAGRIEEARAHYQTCIAIEPKYGEVYFNYGNLLSDERNFEAAAIHFEKALEYPQMYSKTLNNLATTYFRLGRWQEAELRFKESIKLAPDQATTYNNLASLYGEAKMYKESEEMFRKALELHPTYTEAYFNLGTLMVQVGKLDKAESLLQHALTLNPNHHGAANNLKVAQFQKQKRQ